MTDLIEEVREILRDWKKSPLQVQLESEGWEWKSNEQIAIETNPEGIPTSEELRSMYQERHSEVRLEQAYDINANPLPINKWVAAYTKES